MQNGIVGKAHERDRVIANIQVLVDKARAEHVPVLWVQHSSDELPRGSESWQYVPELKRLDTEPLVHKTYGDSFEATDLEELLAERKVGRLAVTGADRGVHPLNPARCAGARPRRHPRRRRAHHRGYARMGVPRHAGRVDRLHQRVLELGGGARPKRERRAHDGGQLLSGLSTLARGMPEHLLTPVQRILPARHIRGGAATAYPRRRGHRIGRLPGFRPPTNGARNGSGASLTCDELPGMCEACGSGPWDGRPR
jgi:hypothetical protein